MKRATPATLYLHLNPADANPNGVEGGRLLLSEEDTYEAISQNIQLTSGDAHLAHQSQPDSPEFYLRIYHFNDLHGSLMRLSRGADESVIPRIAWRIRSTRQSWRNRPDTAVLVISAGDDSGGSIFDELLRDDDLVHPAYQLYSKMGVDVVGIGNHEFDWGIGRLSRAIQRDARFPVLVANLKGCLELKRVCHPAAILDIRGIRVGLIGVVTRAETHLDPNTCQITDPIPVVQHLVQVIRPWCDVLILISHLGASLAKSSVPMFDAGDVEIALSLPPGSLDLIVGGHSHDILNREGLQAENIVNGIPIVQAGSCGEYLGQVDLIIHNHSAKVTQACLIPVANLPDDQEFKEKEVQPFVLKARRLMNQYLGQVENDLDLSTTVMQRDFARRELPLPNFITDALVERLMQYGYPVDFSMIDASALHSGLPYGEKLTYGDCFELLPYADTIRLYQLKKSQLYDLLADNALRIDHPNENDIERGFLHFSHEIKYTIELGKTRMDAQVRQVTFRDISLEKLVDKTYIIATPRFTRELSAPWEAEWNRSSRVPLLDLHRFSFTETDLLLRQEIVAYIQLHGGILRKNGAQLDGRLRVEKNFGYHTD
jgi:2',3'-cyclic-nucleotide 2'-phosphodiesterase (5'-nucleotidase family)